MFEIEVDLDHECFEDECPANSRNEQCGLCRTVFRDDELDNTAAPSWCHLREEPAVIHAKRGQSAEEPGEESTTQVTLWWKTRVQRGSPMRPKLGVLLIRLAAWLVRAKVRVVVE